MFSCAVMLMNDVTFIWTFNIFPTTCLKNLPEHFLNTLLQRIISIYTNENGGLSLA